MLHQRIKAVVERHRSAREASLAYGFEANFLGAMLRDPNRIPDVETLDRLAGAFDWDLCDVVKWALGREESGRPPAPARPRLMAALADMGLSVGSQMIVVQTADSLAAADAVLQRQPRRAPPNVESQ